MTTLKQGERSILATLPSSSKAKAAAEALEAVGFKVQMDVVSQFPREPDENFNNPVAGQAMSLSALTLNSESGSSGDVGPLLAADPAVSGMSPGDDPVEFDSFLVTVLTPEDRVQEAVGILKQHGGDV